MAGAESELACSGGAWFAARLRQGPALPTRARGAAGAAGAAGAGAPGAWLITGGLGGLGLRAASLLAEEYRGAPLLLANPNPNLTPNPNPNPSPNPSPNPNPTPTPNQARRCSSRPARVASPATGRVSTRC